MNLRRFRRLNRLYARLAGYFWLPCPLCGEMFGGHECGTKTVPYQPREFLPGLGANADISMFPATCVACWRHG